MYKILFLLWSISCFAQLSPPNGGGSAAGPAGGDLSGTFPNPTVTRINGGVSPMPCSGGQVAAGITAVGDATGCTPFPTPTIAPSYPANQATAGCGVEYTTGLNYTVAQCVYSIGGTSYSSALTNITLSTADPTNPRIDVLGVDVTGVVFVTPGTPAATPQQPTVDVSTQLALTFVLVPAMGSAPSNVTSTTLYDENTGGEWTCAVSAHLNCGSTVNPYHLTKDIEATAAVLNNNTTLTIPAANISLANYNSLTFFIRSKAAWPSANNGANAKRVLVFSWLNGSTQVGSQVTLSDNSLGFSSAVTSAYQQVSMPMSLFQTGSAVVTKLLINVGGNSGSSSIGFYIDEVTLQAGQGITTLPNTITNFRGAWTSTTAYNINDIVTSGGVGYIALASNTNIAVSTVATWSQFGSITLRTCTIDNDTQSATALSTANISGGCVVPSAATIVEVDVLGGTGTTGSLSTTGTSSINLQKYTPSSGSTSTILSGALATASGKACAKSSTSASCLNGLTSSNSITISTPAVSAGDSIRISAATPDAAQTWYRISIHYTIP